MSNISYSRAFLFSAGFFGISTIWALFNNFVPIVLGRLGLNASLVGFIMTWDNYLNMFVQPAVGTHSDTKYTRIGRRKPWIIIGAPIAALAFASIPLSTSLFAIIAGILLTNVGMALFRAPTVALLGDLFPAEQRSIAGGILDLMGGLGAVVGLAGGWLLVDRLELDLEAAFAFGSVVLLAAVLVVVLHVREPRDAVAGQQLRDAGVLIAPDPRRVFHHRDRSLGVILLALFCGFLGVEVVLVWLSSFGLFSLGINPGRMAGIGTSFAVASLMFSLPAGRLATRFGRQQTIFTGYSMLSVLLVGGWFIRSELGLVVMLILGGMTWALVSVNALPLIYDVVGDAHIGAATGLYYLATNSAAAIGPQVSGVLIDVASNNYRVIFLISATFMVLATLIVTRINRGARARG